MARKKQAGGEEETAADQLVVYPPRVRAQWDAWAAFAEKRRGAAVKTARAAAERVARLNRGIDSRVIQRTVVSLAALAADLNTIGDLAGLCRPEDMDALVDIVETVEEAIEGRGLEDLEHLSTELESAPLDAVIEDLEADLEDVRQFAEVLGLLKENIEHAPTVRDSGPQFDEDMEEFVEGAEEEAKRLREELGEWRTTAAASDAVAARRGR